LQFVVSCREEITVTDNNKNEEMMSVIFVGRDNCNMLTSTTRRREMTFANFLESNDCDVPTMTGRRGGEDFCYLSVVFWEERIVLTTRRAMTRRREGDDICEFFWEKMITMCQTGQKEKEEMTFASSLFCFGRGQCQQLGGRTTTISKKRNMTFASCLLFGSHCDCQHPLSLHPQSTNSWILEVVNCFALKALVLC